MIRKINNEQLIQKLIKLKKKISAENIDNLDIKESFFHQSCKFYSYSINDLLSLYSQRQSMTDLRTFDQWKEVNRFILSGETAVYLLEDYFDSKSKRKALFDINQTTGKTISSSTSLTNDELKEVIHLLSDTKMENRSLEEMLKEYIEKYAERGLKEYAKLTDDEKKIVPLISFYTLDQQFELTTDRKAYFKQLNDLFFSSSTVRYIPTLQVANKMTTVIMDTFNSVLEQAKEQLTAHKSKESLNSKESNIDGSANVQIETEAIIESKINEVQELSLFDSITEDESKTSQSTDNVNVSSKKDQLIPKDFSVTGSNSVPYSIGIVKKIQDNLEAVRLVKKLAKTQQQATADNQKTLARYSGWGGIANELFDTRQERFAKERRELRMLMTPDEYRKIEDSSLTSYYTDPELITLLWSKLEQAGFNKGKILDPSMGTGNFFSAMPTNLKQGSQLVGVEIEPLTGQIAKQLHPSAKIEVKGFEDTKFANGSFDLVIGNIPFNNMTLSDSTYKNMMIHDYFFRKSIDLVRDGGVLAFITSTGTMDKADIRLRENLAKEADLIAGYRLPNNAFRATANIDVTSDLLIFQKKTSQQRSEEYLRPTWVNRPKNETTPNAYFVENPTHILGELFVKNFNGQTLSVKPTEDYLSLFNKESLPLVYEKANIPVEQEQPLIIESKKEEAESNLDSIELFTFSIQNEKIYYRNNESVEEIPPRNKKTLKRMGGMIEFREEIRELIRIQKIENYDASIFEKQLEHVNSLYDQFVAKYGYFHDQANKLIFRNDDYYPLLCSTEIGVEDDFGVIHYEKAEIFLHATIRPKKTIVKVNNALEALQVSVNSKQTIDFKYMQQIYGKDSDEMIHELGTEIFLNPATLTYETANEYLSGDVKSKLEIVNTEIENGDTTYEINQKELQKVIPKDLTIGDINYQIGTAWVPERFYIEFLKEKFTLTDNDLNTFFKLEKNPMNKEFFITGKKKFRSPLVTQTYGTKKKNAYELFEDLLNFKNTTVYKIVEVDTGDGKITEKSVVDVEASLLCREKQEVLRTEFKQWVESSNRRFELEEIYNTWLNRYVVRKYDGSSLTFGTMNPSIELMTHQKNAVQRTVIEGRGLLAHVVGGGKTLTMIASGMKLKELGLVKKTLYLVPKSLIRSFGEEIVRAYPDKKVLIATDRDFKKENRKLFIAKVATGNYDAIVMGHTQFAKIPLSKKRYATFLQNEIDTLKAQLMECEDQSHSFKVIRAELKKAEIRLENQLRAMNHDRILDFEDLGVDFLFVDEAHMYKNLGVKTKLGGVAGISTISANKSLDMLAKIRYIQEENNGRGVVFATGTPISNSMCELYTMNRYLAPDILDELGVSHFDDWQGVFGEIENKLEMTPESSGYRVRERFAKFHNIPELMIQFSRFADVQTADMLNLPTPKVNKIIVETKSTPMQELKMQELAKRSEAIRKGLVLPTEDNMLKITSEARRMALDPRLLSDEIYGRDDSNKIKKCVENVYKLWNEQMDSRATQIIFSDIGTPSNKSFNAYNEIKSLLIEKGIPKDEIQFIHDANSDIQKEKLFKDVRIGKVRVLLGSTEKLGTGVNVQNKLIAIHNLDCPWRPSDLEQRLGRIERQGNEFGEVFNFTYITKGTFDSYLFQIQEQKLTYITQIMSSKSIARSANDLDELVVQASEVKALATGNPLIKKRADLENEIRRLTLLKSSHYQQASSIELSIDQSKRLIPSYEERIKRIHADIEEFTQQTSEKESFFMTIENQTFNQEVKKAKIGKILLDRIEQIRTQSIDLKSMREKILATYNGFPVHFNGIVANSSNLLLQVKGQTTYSLQIKSGSTTSLMLKLSRLKEEMERNLNRTKDLLNEEKKNLSELTAQKDQPFARQNELNEKQQTLKVVDELIELGMNLEDVIELDTYLKEKSEISQSECEIKDDSSIDDYEIE